jgi:hypothetical protein
MKTSLRISIITMSLAALVAFVFASETFAKSFPFQQIEIKNTGMKSITVPIKNDGTFSVPGPLKSGAYSFTLINNNAPTQATATNSGKINGASMSSGGDNPTESVTVSKITIDLQIVTPPDPATGAMTGKRQHSPLSIMKVRDVSSPNLFNSAVSPKVDVGTGTLDEDCNGFTGKITFTYTHGGKSSQDSWTK